MRGKLAGVPDLHQQTDSLREEPAGSLSARDEFQKVIAPVERIARKRLTGHGLELCRRGFEQFPDGFSGAAERAAAKQRLGKVACAVGLLVRMVRDGEHRVDPDTSTEGGRDADARPFAAYDD